jgi:hypothetical protein
MECRKSSGASQEEIALHVALISGVAFEFMPQGCPIAGLVLVPKSWYGHLLSVTPSIRRATFGTQLKLENRRVTFGFAQGAVPKTRNSSQGLNAVES